MQRLLARTGVRRGLLVALDGLAIWLLAIVLAAYVAPKSVAGGGGSLLSRSVETTRLWVETPGVGAFELVAYAGLAVTVVGPLWYLVGRPVAVNPRRDRSTDDHARDGDGFRYDPPSTSARGGAGPAGRDPRPLGAPRTSLPGRGGPDGLRRVADLFDPEPPPGGFLRGAGGSDDEPGPTPTTAGGTGDGAGSVESEAGVEDGAVDVTAGTTIDGLESALAESRARLEPVPDRLAAAANGADVEAADADLASIAGGTDEPPAPPRAVDRDDTRAIRQRLSAARARQRRIESALDEGIDRR